MVNRFLPLVFIPVFIFSDAIAGGPKLKLTGKMDVRFIDMRHNAALSYKNSLTPMKPHDGFDSNLNVAAEVSNKSDSGLVYGARINLETTARNNRGTSSHIYITTDYGKIEFGSDKSAVAKMKITSTSNAAGTAGGWDMYVKSDPASTSTEYITGWSGFLDQKSRGSGSKNNAEFSRKITYYTPVISGWQVGVSYIPDTDNRGYDVPSSTDNVTVSKVRFVDAIAAAVFYSKKIDSDLSFRSAVAYETAKSVPLSITSGGTKNSYKLSRLSNYTIGSEVKYKDFSLAASYGNYMKSCTNKDLDIIDRNTNLYGATAKYIWDKKLSVSLGGFVSKHKGSKFSSATLAADYAIMPGILPYAEITIYKTSGKYKKSSNNIVSDSSKGTVFVAGLRVQF